jgi:hypothetical protein
VEKPLGKWSLGTSRRLKKNIKNDVREVCCEVKNG